jgi:hypothetical protein
MEIFALMSHFITCTPSLLEDIGILNVLFIAGYKKNHATKKVYVHFYSSSSLKPLQKSETL